MSNTEVQANVVTFNSVINACARCAPFLDKFRAEEVGLSSILNLKFKGDHFGIQNSGDGRFFFLDDVA